MNAVTGLKSQIEEAVRARSRGSARTAIAQYVRDAPDRGEAIIEASEWYRRLGDYRKALRILEPEKLVRAPRDTATSLGKRLLQMAYIMNYLGANEFAASVTSGLRCHEAEDYRKLGQIAADQFDSVAARKNFEAFHALDSNQSSYRSRLAQIAYADVLCDALEHERAVELAQGVLTSSREPLLLGICHQAIGEYEARRENWKGAERELRIAESLFPDQEDTVDSAFLWKWQAYVRARLGDKKSAEILFRKAETILDRGGLRIEAMLHLKLLRFKAGMLPRHQWLRVWFYPGLPSGFRRLMGDDNPCDRHFFGPKKGARFTVDFSCGEFTSGNRPRLGISLEQRCLADLAIVGDWGIEINRLLSLLWPDEVFSFLQLSKRLEAVFSRLRRHYDLVVEVRENRAVLSRSSRSKIRVIVGEETSISFLRKHKAFRCRDFSKYYGLSQTQAGVWLRELTSKGKVVATGRGSASSYQRIDEIG